MSTEPGNGASTRTIKVDALARVEGEGAMSVRIRDGRVEEVALRIYEPPRFFEALLRGRAAAEVPDIVSRICGICPIAYQMSALAAIEDALGIAVPEEVRLLRRLIYCGEWIQSHGLHVYMLHAPDFLGYDGAIEMAKDHPQIVENALGMKKAGNLLMEVVGGRAIHPVNVRIGGFYRAPTAGELAPVAEALERARETALETVRWTATLDYPDYERDYLLVALRQPGEYAIERGRVVSSTGLDIDVADYDAHFVESQVPHSTALHSRLRTGESYLAGPMARFNLSFGELVPSAREAVIDAGVMAPCLNPFRSIVMRSAEIVHACEEALAIIAGYVAPDPPAVEVAPRAGAGQGATEAPRGLLWHRYELAQDASVLEARIVPPTSQNQATIEEDMAGVVGTHLDLDDAALTRQCEQAIRNYDPCISCATHFLRLDIDRD